MKFWFCFPLRRWWCTSLEFERWAKPWRECARGVEEALNQADPTRSCERGGKLAAGLIILISFTLWITVELDSRGELPEIDELFSPGPGKMHPRAFTP